MIKCVALYPHEINEEYKKKVSETIALAFKYGFNEIFTTLHLPEYSFIQQFNCFEIIASEAKKYNLELTVDLGGSFINDVLNDEEIINKIKKYNLDFIRLDYGYDMKQVKELYEALNIQGFVINASTYSKQEVNKIISNFKSIDENIKIRACHNYYIRKESGLDEAFASRQDSFFEEYDIPVYYCIPTKSCPRGPLHLGLCTIEKHRDMKLEDIFIDLLANHNLNAFMMADEWLKEEEFIKVETILNSYADNDKKIMIEFFDGTSDKEKNIVLGKHMFRYDSPLSNIRSQSSRQMAEFATKIIENNTIERKKGYITIDNRLYKRYSGEMQVIIHDLDADERVNVVAKLVNENDIYKLLNYKLGYEYTFEEEK